MPLSKGISLKNGPTGLSKVPATFAPKKPQPDKTPARMTDPPVGGYNPAQVAMNPYAKALANKMT